MRTRSCAQRSVGQWRCRKGPERTSKRVTSSSSIWDSDRPTMGVFSLSTLVVVAIVAFDYRLMRMRCNFNRLTFGGIEQAWGVLALGNQRCYMFATLAVATSDALRLGRALELA